MYIYLKKKRQGINNAVVDVQQEVMCVRFLTAAGMEFPLEPRKPRFKRRHNENPRMATNKNRTSTHRLKRDVFLFVCFSGFSGFHYEVSSLAGLRLLLLFSLLL